MTEGSITILDAGPIIHLDEMDCLDLIEGFEAVIAPKTVWEEALKHRPQLDQAVIAGLQIQPDPAAYPSALGDLIDEHDLDKGEIAALAPAMQLGGDVILSDYIAARAAAESPGFIAMGTLGLMRRGFLRGKRSLVETLRLLEELPLRSTLHVSRRLMDEFKTTFPTS